MPRNVRNVATAELTGGEPIPERLSAGCAFYPEDGEDYASLLKYADTAMYKVKRERKHRELEE